MSTRSADPIVKKRRERKAKQNKKQVLERVRAKLIEEKKSRVCIECHTSLVCITCNLRRNPHLNYMGAYHCKICNKHYVDTSAGSSVGIIEVPRYCKLIETVGNRGSACPACDKLSRETRYSRSINNYFSRKANRKRRKLKRKRGKYSQYK